MAGDTTAATTAKRKQLEAELLDAQKALEESYYDHSITSRQDALDKEFSSFEEEKNKEMENWDEYLKNVDTVVTDSLNYVQSQTQVVYNTLNEMGRQYGLTLTDSITTPWKNGATAIDDYSATFKTACSNWTVQLDAIKTSWKNAKEEVDAYAQSQIDALNVQMGNTQGAGTTGNTNNNNNNNNTQQPAAQPKPATPAITVGGKINAGSARIYATSNGTGGGKQYYSNDPIYTVLQEKNGYLLVRYHKLSSGYTGWFKKSDVSAAYAQGTLGTKKNELALVDELGDELILHSQNGRLAYLSKGSGVVPADITEKIINIATDPVGTLSDMMPKTQLPSIEKKDFNFEFKFDSLLRVDHADQNSIPALRKMVREEFNGMMGQVNSKLKRA